MTSRLSGLLPAGRRSGAAGHRRPGRVGAVAGILVTAVLLGGCNLPSFEGYNGQTTQGHDEFKLYQGMMMAGVVIGGIVTVLILWSIIRYRRRSEEMPRQFQYQHAIEIFYTVVPVIIVLVLFYFTVLTENNVDALVPNAPVQVTVTAFQWGWEFQYTNGVSNGITIEGETTQVPQMVLPVGETTQITLVSKDVIHGFYVPEFNFSRYAQPGYPNVFDVTLKTAGTFRGQCTQFCGLYHSLMFFSVKGVSPEQFNSWAGSQGASASSSASGLAAAKQTKQETARA